MGLVSYGCGQVGTCVFTLFLVLRADGDKSSEPKRFVYSIFLQVFSRKQVSFFLLMLGC